MTGEPSAVDALLDAVRDHLRQQLELRGEECDVTPDGKPNPASGDRFVAVHPGDVTNQQVQCLDERFGFKVTVTVRTLGDPRDRRRDGGAWALALRVRAALHMSYAVCALAAAADPKTGFVEPPCFEAGRYLGPQGADWFWSEADDDCGVAVELSFGKVRQVMYIDEQGDRV